MIADTNSQPSREGVVKARLTAGRGSLARPVEASSAG